MRTLFLIAMTVSCSIADDRPNIIVVLSDDMGFSDIGCYGGEIETPNLDGLAANGLRFTQFYNTGRCCPTRASLLTGLYPHQAGVGHMMNDRGHDGYRGELNKQCLTMAEVLKPAGYETYMTGKWHVTTHIQPEGPKFNWPRQRGFDHFYGTITGAGSFFDPGTLTRENTMISPFADPEYKPQTYYYTNAISDHVVRNIESRDAEKPFFMYVTYTAAHWPMHALEKDIAKYKGRYDNGYAPVRAARLKRMHEMGLIDAEWSMAPQIGDWDKVEHKAWESRCMEVYAAMIDSMDQGIGHITSALKAREMLDNTLILFMQDNGGCQEGNGRRGDFKRPVAASLPPMKATDISTAVVPKQNRRGVPTLTGPGIMPGPEDTYIAYGINWANTSNTPFREYKHYVHEGGISTPLIAHWPKGIHRKNELEHQPGHLIDIMATCVDLAKANYPTKVGENDIKPLEGRSLVPAFAGKTIDRDAIYWEHEGNRAIRKGKWKLVAKENKPWELYDMDLDRTETTNLATARPELVKQLAAQWTAYADRANVSPVGTWRGKPRKQQYNKKQKSFTFRQGDHLDASEAPYIQGKAFTITAEVMRWGDGVIVAQGGTAHGFALYVKDGKLTFSTRIDGQHQNVAVQTPASAKTVSARIDRNGKVTLKADGKRIGSGEVAGTMTSMPIDGLDVGSDRGGFVGDYDTPFKFTGKTGTVGLRLGNHAER